MRNQSPHALEDLCAGNQNYSTRLRVCRSRYSESNSSNVRGKHVGSVMDQQGSSGLAWLSYVWLGEALYLLSPVVNPRDSQVSKYLESCRSSSRPNVRRSHGWRKRKRDAWLLPAGRASRGAEGSSDFNGQLDNLSTFLHIPSIVFD